MAGQTFNEPKLSLNRIYTRRGDLGETSLAGGKRILKDHPRIRAYGTIDELSAFIGAACVSAQDLASGHREIARLGAILLRVQHELFNLGSILAASPGDTGPKQPTVTAADIQQLETEIDQANSQLEPLPSFVLPGGCRLNTDLHICRTVCRRAERLVLSLSRQEPVPPETLRYLNRLSDAFFVWSRQVCAVLGVTETLWSPNESASARSSD